jgi:hypothetical protein
MFGLFLNIAKYSAPEEEEKIILCLLKDTD